MREQSLYETNEYIKKGEMVVALTSEFDLTEDRVYVTTKNQGDNSFGNSLWVINDKGEEVDYTNEYFRKYNGETISNM